MISIESAVAEFLLNCEAEGLADSTIRWYRSITSRFAQHHQAMALADIGSHEIRLYLKNMRNGQYADESVDDHNRALHRFWNWTAQEYVILNPMRNIKRPKAIKVRTPKAVPLENIIAMFRAAEGGMNTVRDQAILAFALDTGCRAGGICGLKAADVDLQSRTATVTEKGNKTRVVPFSKVTAVLLARWMEERLEPAEAFFYSQYTWESLRPNSLYLLFRRLGSRAEVTGKVNPHGFRHTFSIEYIKAGGDLVTLSRILGHESVDTTAKYYGIFTNEEVKAAHERYSPIYKIFNREDEQSERIDNE